MSTQPPLESLILSQLATLFPDLEMEPVPEARLPLTSFFFNTTGFLNRFTLTGTLTLHFNEEDTLDALQRAYATESEIIAGLPAQNDHYCITGARLLTRGPVFDDTLAFLGVECTYAVDYTVGR